MIQNIEVRKIAPHPNNPRKDLGDLTELAESIKVKGILQNLTVVPLAGSEGLNAVSEGRHEAEYVAVIGHRRLAAAELAGLDEAPCAVADMSLGEQIATMLLENIQRSDLTVYEQAQGFQLMIDMGDTVKGISEKTGFSETTVRRRVRLTELDPEKFKKSECRGGTLADYAELSRINDPEVRDRVLDAIGTANFAWELKRALNAQTAKENADAIAARLGEFAERAESVSGLRYIGKYASADDVAVPEDADTVRYFFSVSEYSGCANLYTEPAAEDENGSGQREAAEAAEAAERERKAALKEISERAYGLRFDFIRNLSPAKAKKSMGLVTKNLLDVIILGGVPDLEMLTGIAGIEEKEFDTRSFAERYAGKHEYCLITAAYCALDTDWLSPFNWKGRYAGSKRLDAVYDFLGKLGYEPSDEERAFLDGTHELFVPADEK